MWFPCFRYVKPHGALYNTMMRESEVFKAIAKAIAKYDSTIQLMILSSSKNETYAKIAQKYGVQLIYELFADRAYSDEGFLLSRKESGAVIHDTESVLQRIKLVNKKQKFSEVN